MSRRDPVFIGSLGRIDIYEGNPYVAPLAGYFTFGVRRAGSDEICVSNRYFRTVERAYVAGVASMHLGEPGAGGAAVGTADDWFFRMMGVDE